MKRAIFLDRDGTINKYGEYIYKKEDFIFIDGAIELIKKFNDLGYLVIVVSNQAGIGKGYYTQEDLIKLQSWVDSELSKYNAHIDEWLYCPHHPDAVIDEFKIDCDCRKPKTGMIDLACKKYEIDRANSIMVGDKEWDYQCGINAGLHSFILENENYSKLNKELDEILRGAMVDVSIIFVNYNTTKILLDCLKSVKEKTQNVNYEIIIVDNNSNEENKLLLNTLGEDCRVIFSEENLGFGKANNLASEKAKGQYLFFLNTDTVLMNNSIYELFNCMQTRPDFGVAGGNLYNAQGQLCHSHLMIMPSIQSIIRNEILPWRFSYQAKYPNYNYNLDNQPIEVGYITGADFMIRKDIFDKVGGFDKDFFMYCEESELCNRVRKLGLKIVNCPTSKIIHYEGSSTNNDNNSFNERQFALKNGESQFLYYKKVYGSKYVKKYYCTKKFAIWARFYRNKNYRKELSVLKNEYRQWKKSTKKDKQKH